MAQTTFRKFTLDEYHKMIETGVLMDGEPYELLEGNLVHKMSRGSPHDTAIQVLTKRFVRLVPPGWDYRGQSAITLPSGSEPEPDCALVRGDENTYRSRHPGPGEVGLVVEVSASSLLIDRHDKGRIYAESGIPIYWVVNVVEKVIEVYTQPSGPIATAAYAKCDVFAVGSDVPVVLDGNTIGTIAVADVVG
ncbi:MAG: Uma2 family endonuclease [Planctomycetaceae bacterium]|nr:Uma2 family endonuclease [Planctomycetaceae bacterium]